MIKFHDNSDNTGFSEFSTIEISSDSSAKPKTPKNSSLKHSWWDNYEGQETIVFNDFRGGLPFSDLLQLCDKYSYYVKRRNRDPYPVSSKT